MEGEMKAKRELTYKVEPLFTEAFFGSLFKVIDGSYRRLQMGFENMEGECFIATFYRCGEGSENSKRFYRIDIKKSIRAV
jgi:hypothetical protein